MSANINMNNGRASMVYTGETPWHSLGTRFTERPTFMEALVAAEADYTVEQIPLEFLAGENGWRKTVPGYFANVRKDTMQPLGVSTNRYQIIQNSDAAIVFDMLDILGENMIETAGVLGNGETCWFLVKLPSQITLKGGDEINEYLLFFNSFQPGTSATWLYWTFRVVCQNTLAPAIKASKSRLATVRSDGSRHGIRIPHRGDVQARMREVPDVLGLVNQEREIVRKAYELLADTKVSAIQEKAFVEKLIPDTFSKDEYAVVQTRSIIENLIEGGPGAQLESSKGTAWGMLNGFTRWVDHDRKSPRDQGKKAFGMLAGSPSVLKNKALQFALATAK